MTASSRQTVLKTGKHAWRSSSSSVVVVILVVNSSEIQHDDADDELLRTNHSSTQPSIPPGSVNEYQLRLGKQRQMWFIPLANETQGVQVKLCYPLTTRAITERLMRRFVWRRYTDLFYFTRRSPVARRLRGACRSSWELRE